MKNMNKILLVGAISLGFSASSYAAGSMSTGLLQNTTTAGSPLVSDINATPASVIRLDVAGAKFSGSATPISVTITVDTATPVVLTGNAADQLFRDDAIGAAYFGYYLSTGVRSANQPNAALNVKVKKGSGETANRSYYLLGNGTTTPTVQGDLTAAPASATTFVSPGKNAVHCGPQYSANGIAAGLGCAGGTTSANMDITQFVKVLYTDSTASAVVSELEFTAVNE